jgi:hypothetical protein
MFVLGVIVYGVLFGADVALPLPNTTGFCNTDVPIWGYLLELSPNPY